MTVVINPNRNTVRQFNLGYAYDLAKFSEDSEGNSLVKKALVATEGKFKDSNGNEHDFSPSRLETIAEYTNKAIDSGTTVPVCKDHKKEYDSTVGTVAGKAYTKVVTQEDLPNPKATHLIGKIGLFLDDVVVKAENAIQNIKNGISSVSMGLNLDPNDHRIVELSLVPIPAIPNMGLFAFTGVDENNIFSWEELETSEQTLDSLKQDYDTLTENLWKLLNNIYTSESIDITDVITLKQYVYSVLNGFSLRVVDLLGLTSVPDDPANPMNQASTQTAEQALSASNTQYQDLTMQQPTYSRSTSNTANFSRAPKFTRASKYTRA